MDTILWEGRRQKHAMEAMEHQRRRIDFHQHYYFRCSNAISCFHVVLMHFPIYDHVIGVLGRWPSLEAHVHLGLVPRGAGGLPEPALPEAQVATHSGRASSY